MATQREPSRSIVRPRTESSDATSAIPIARVRRIIKLDPEIKSVSSDASFLIAKATEMFIEMFVGLCHEEMKRDTKQPNRNTIVFEDLAVVARSVDQMDFLHDLLIEPTECPTISPTNGKGEQVK